MPNKILLIQTAFIGDVILATAVLEKLHKSQPQAQLDVLVRKGNEGIFRAHPFVNEVLIWDKKRKYRSLWGLWRKIRKTKYDTVINLQRFAATGFLTGFSGAAQRIGFQQTPFSSRFTHKQKHELDGKHETERNQALIAAITDAQTAKPRIYPSADDYAKVAEYQQQPYICLAPASVWATKRMPAENWIGFMNILPPMYRVYLLGAPDDSDLCEQIRTKSRNKNAENLAGKLDLLQSAALMQKAAMNYVNDSAPLHLASAVNAPVTAIFCSTVPEFGFTPLSDRSHIVAYTGELDCRPCGLHGKKACPKKHFRCGDIAAEDLLKCLF